jgi:hypothetical protein
VASLPFFARMTAVIVNIQSSPSACLVSDDEIRGFAARQLQSVVATYGYKYRGKTARQQRWFGLGLITP